MLIKEGPVTDHHLNETPSVQPVADVNIETDRNGMKRMERNGKLFFVIIGMSVSTCFRRHTVLLKRECAYGKRFFFVIVIIGISENALFCSWRHEISLHCTD
jgi:hypothetical protein